MGEKEEEEEEGVGWAATDRARVGAKGGGVVEDAGSGRVLIAAERLGDCADGVGEAERGGRWLQLQSGSRSREHNQQSQ